jgi:hypothetical protein
VTLSLQDTNHNKTVTMLNAIMLSAAFLIVMLNDIMLNVVLLSVVAPICLARVEVTATISEKHTR